MISTNLAKPLEARPATQLHIGDATFVLDFICPACQGQQQPCHHCQGRRTVVSQDGARLLAFFKKYLSLP